MSKIKGICFDLDGVLVDATEWHYDAMNDALKLFGFEITRDEHLNEYNGLPTKKKLERLSQQKGLPASLHQFIYDMKQNYTKKVMETSCVPSYEKILMASRLKTEGYKLCVCSNSIRPTIDTMLEKSALTEYFDFVLSNTDVKNPKPDPEIYLSAFQKWGFKPAECVIVEDNDHGIKAASESGGNVLRVRHYGDVNYVNVKSFIEKLEGGSL